MTYENMNAQKKKIGCCYVYHIGHESEREVINLRVTAWRVLVGL